MSFKEAYEHAQILWSKLRAGSAVNREVAFRSRGDLLTTMGRSPKSGTSHSIAASLVHFGFLERTESDEYRLTPDGRDLLSLDQDSDRWQQAARTLAVKPELYQYLRRRYPSELPGSISSELIDQYGDRNINRANVENVLKDYRQSLGFAGYPVQTGEMERLKQSVELQEVQFNGQTMLISKKFLLEAYEKTLEENLRQVKETLQGWA